MIELKELIKHVHVEERRVEKRPCLKLTGKDGLLCIPFLSVRNCDNGNYYCIIIR